MQIHGTLRQHTRERQQISLLRSYGGYAEGENTAVRERAKPASVLSLLHECVVFYVKLTIEAVRKRREVCRVSLELPCSWSVWCSSSLGCKPRPPWARACRNSSPVHRVTEPS